MSNLTDAIYTDWTTHDQDTISDAFSANDVFVQISLPLVLILAISLHIASSVQARILREAADSVEQFKENGTYEAYLEVYKQILIRRIDRVCAATEQDWGLPVLPGVERVHFQDGWPQDAALQKLCRSGVDGLSDIQGLSARLYRQAIIHSEPPSHDGVHFPAMHDPTLLPSTRALEVLPPGVAVDDAARAFALGYIERKCLKWRDQIEALQTEIVIHVISDRSADAIVADEDVNTAKRKLSVALAERGYQMLPNVLGVSEGSPHGQR